MRIFYSVYLELPFWLNIRSALYTSSSLAQQWWARRDLNTQPSDLESLPKFFRDFHMQRHILPELLTPSCRIFVPRTELFGSHLFFKSQTLYRWWDEQSGLILYTLSSSSLLTEVPRGCRFLLYRCRYLFLFLREGYFGVLKNSFNTASSDALRFIVSEDAGIEPRTVANTALAFYCALLQYDNNQMHCIP